MSPESIGSLTEATTTVIFVVFVLYLQRSQQSSVKLNHEEWQAWLTSQNQAWRDGMRDIVNLFTTEATKRHDEASTERAQMTEAMRRLSEQIERLTTINLIVYATLKGKTDEAEKLEQELVR